MSSSQSTNVETIAGEWQAWLWALGATIVGFGLLNLLIHGTPLLLPMEPWLTMWLELSLLVAVGLLLCLWMTPWHTTLKLALSVSVVSMLLTFIVLATLKTTPYTLDALSGDQGLYTAYVTKFATYAGNVDAIYADLPAFYPPLYFYLLGRIAAWLHLEPFTLLKVGLLATTLALPLLVSWSWRRLVSLPFAVATAFTLLVEQQWYKPAEWVTMVLFVPWWLYYVENCASRSFHTHWARWRWWFVGGLLGAILFQGYYYWFFIGGVSLLLQLLRNALQQSTRKHVGGLLSTAVPMLVSAAIFSSIYWWPYLASMAQSGGWQILQNRWIAVGELTMPLPFAEENFTAIALLIGLLYLAVAAQDNRVMRSLLYFLVAVYGWFALGYVGLLAATPLLSFRAYPLATYLAALGLAFAVVHLWQSRAVLTTGHHTFSAARVSATFGIVFVLFFGQNTVLTWLKNEDVPKAVAMRYPAAQMTALDEAVGNSYRDKTILLSRDYVDWIAYRPFFSFLSWSAHYSHPAAHFYERLALLEKVTTVHSSQLFAAALFYNRYDHIEHLLLKSAPDSWQMTFLDDNFPNRNRQRTLSFAKTNLTAPYFTEIPAGERILLTPDYSVEPILNWPNLDRSSVAFMDAVTIYSLVSGFGEHLAGSHLEALQKEAGALLAEADLSLLPIETLLDLYQFAEEPLRTEAYKTLAANFIQPLSQPLTDQNGVPKLQMLGYSARRATAEQPFTVSIYLEVLDTLERDYTIWFHAIREGEKHDLDFTPVLPTTTWLPGQVLILQRTLSLAPHSYELLFGFWHSAEDVRLVLPSGEVGIALGAMDIE